MLFERIIDCYQRSAGPEKIGEVFFKDFALPSVVFRMPSPSLGRRRRQIQAFEISLCERAHRQCGAVKPRLKIEIHRRLLSEKSRRV